jgi:hypothetical protein
MEKIKGLELSFFLGLLDGMVFFYWEVGFDDDLI